MAITIPNTFGPLTGSIPTSFLDANFAAVVAGAAALGANADITSLGALTTPISLIALRGYIDGCIMSTAGGSATMSIAAGAAMSSTNAYLMQLAATTKTTSAWAVGTGLGGLDTAAIANNTWYHFYAIRRPDTGVVDVVFSTNASSPTLPTNYTQYRRIGSGLTNGIAQWRQFVQYGNTFLWYQPALDVSVNNPGIGAGLVWTVGIPLGIVTEAIINGGYRNASSPTAGNAYFSAPAVSDDAASGTSAPLWSAGATTESAAGGVSSSVTQMRVFSNTLSQIRARPQTSTVNTQIYISVLGWVDLRGRDL